MPISEQIIVMEQILIICSDYEIEHDDEDVARFIYSGQAKMELVNLIKENFVSKEENNAKQKEENESGKLKALTKFVSNYVKRFFTCK